MSTLKEYAGRLRFVRPPAPGKTTVYNQQMEFYAKLDLETTEQLRKVMGRESLIYEAQWRERAGRPYGNPVPRRIALGVRYAIFNWSYYK